MRLNLNQCVGAKLENWSNDATRWAISVKSSCVIVGNNGVESVIIGQQ